MKISARTLTALALLAGLSSPLAAADAKPEAVTAKPASTDPHAIPPFMAVVEGQIISAAEFESRFRDAVRQKFYHGTPPEKEIEQLSRDVAFDMIDRILLLSEAKRRGLKADTADVDAQIANYENRYASSPRWQQEREQILPPLRARLEDDSLLAVLEKDVRKLPEPSRDKVMDYYKKNPEKFTEPEKQRLSLLLLAVDPASPTAAWDAAETEAGMLRLQLTEGGADFAELAKQHSSHDSAARGGDLGYLHRGMIPEGIQEKLDGMKVGELSQPTRVLQGVALFRYDSLQPAKHHEFDYVKGRARDLLMRDLENQAWEDFRKKLRTQAKLELNPRRYPFLNAQTQVNGK